MHIPLHCCRNGTLVAALLLTTACAGMADPLAAPVCKGSVCDAPAGEYHIGPGDVLQISVWKDDSLNRTVPVRPDGMISFPLLNDVQAAGQTPLQLRETLMNKLKQYLATPEVSVVVTEVHSYAVSVMGQVKKPGHYEFKGPATVLDAIAEAGGLNEFASPSKIVVLRHDQGKEDRLAFDYTSALEGSGNARNFYVHSGDIVMVP